MGPKNLDSFSQAHKSSTFQSEPSPHPYDFRYSLNTLLVDFLAVCISPVNPHCLRSRADKWHLANTLSCVGSRHKYSVEISLPWWNSHKDTQSHRLYLETESTIFLLENYGLCFSSLYGLVWFGFLQNGNIHTSLIEGWRYRINYTDVFSRKESHLTRSVHAILGGQGSFSHHLYKCMCMKKICRQPGDMDTAHCLPHCSSSSFIPMFSAPPPALW